jgi:hypothetical protein
VLSNVDPNFGITADIILQNVNTTTGAVDNTVNVTSIAAAAGIDLTTSFSSKSELAINTSLDGTSLTFMGYNATPGQLDISYSNTPGSLEPGNTDIASPTYRAIGDLNLSTNALSVTLTNPYNGNNGRAAIGIGNGQYYTVGNAGNGNGSSQTTLNTGVQLITPSGTNGTLGTNALVGQFNCVAQGYTCSSSDKSAKDNNYRGETIFDGTLYVSKGSGSNGIDTVYQVGSPGTLPAAGATTPITVLPGLNTLPAKTDTDGPHPFGMNGSWVLDYELTGNLIGSSYSVQGTGSLAGYSLTTTTDGLRNLTGKVNANGWVTLYAVTSTEGSVLGGSGADPNQIVEITDTLSNFGCGRRGRKFQGARHRRPRPGVSRRRPGAGSAAGRRVAAAQRPRRAGDLRSPPRQLTV